MKPQGIVARFKLRAVAALMGLYLGTLLGWSWPWGVLFLATTLPTIQSGETHLVDFVSRDENPILFWMITGTWVLLSLALVGWDIAGVISSRHPASP